MTAALAAVAAPAWAGDQTIRVFAAYSARKGCTLVSGSRAITIEEIVNDVRNSPRPSMVIVSAIRQMPERCTEGPYEELRRLGVRALLVPYRLPELRFGPQRPRTATGGGGDPSD